MLSRPVAICTDPSRITEKKGRRACMQSTPRVHACRHTIFARSETVLCLLTLRSQSKGNEHSLMRSSRCSSLQPADENPPTGTPETSSSVRATLSSSRCAPPRSITICWLGVRPRSMQTLCRRRADTDTFKKTRKTFYARRLRKFGRIADSRCNSGERSVARVLQSGKLEGAS